MIPMQKNIWKISALVIFVCCGHACKKPPSKTKEQVIQERLENRLATWEKNYVNRCRKKVIERATSIVDSTLLTDARIKRDISDLPAIPGRPARPGFEAPVDSTPIAPLIQFIRDSLLLDSLGYDSLEIDSLIRDSIFMDSIHLDSIR